MLNYLEKHSANKSTGTPDGSQINSNSEKTPLRKTNETPSKDGKMEKTEWLPHLPVLFLKFIYLFVYYFTKIRTCCWLTSWSELWWWADSYSGAWLIQRASSFFFFGGLFWSSAILLSLGYFTDVSFWVIRVPSSSLVTIAEMIIWKIKNVKQDTRPKASFQVVSEL